MHVALLPAADVPCADMPEGLVKENTPSEPALAAFVPEAHTPPIIYPTLSKTVATLPFTSSPFDLIATI